jgi:hypothetical protein
MPTEIRETCARPGCQHVALVHDGYGCRGRAGVRDLRRDAEVKCPCPSYRTQAQQEAWENLRALLRATKIRDVSWETNKALLAAHHVCELYP